jgi:hypothetical protein
MDTRNSHTADSRLPYDDPRAPRLDRSLQDVDYDLVCLGQKGTFSIKLGVEAEMIIEHSSRMTSTDIVLPADDGCGSSITL